MAIYYIENENGTFLSEDGKRKFMRLCGREAYDYLRSAEGKKKRFMKTGASEDGGEDEYVEVPLMYIRKHRKDERRAQYVSDSQKRSGITIILADDLLSPSEAVTNMDVIQDESVDVEESVIHADEIAMLRKALKALTEDEIAFVGALYLADKPLSEREMAAHLGISQVAVHKRKLAILRKLKKILEK